MCRTGPKPLTQRMRIDNPLEHLPPTEGEACHERTERHHRRCQRAPVASWIATPPPRTTAPSSDLGPTEGVSGGALFRTYGMRRRHGYVRGHPPTPKSQPADGMRRDSFPADGSPPGSSLEFMREQHLARLWRPITWHSQSARTQRPGRDEPASVRAPSPRPPMTGTRLLDAARFSRLKASIVVPYEDPEAAVAEIRKRAGNKDFRQILLLSRTAEALGRRRYWPIYEEAVAHGLAHRDPRLRLQRLARHQLTGWASYYIEEMSGNTGTACSALIASMIFEGPVRPPCPSSRW